MKGFSHLFCFSCLSVLVILLINGYKSESIVSNLELSTDITTNYCNNHVDFDANESYQYIDDQFRYDLCKSNYQGEFDKDGKIFKDYKNCLGPRGQVAVSRNPCAVVCPTIGTYYSESREKATCKQFIDDYTNVTRVILIRDARKECGLNYVCNTQGCCVKKEVTTRGTTTLQTKPSTTVTTTTTTPSTAASTTQTPTTPPTTTTSPTTQTPTTPPTTATSPTTQTPTTPPTTLGPENMCHSVGSFKMPNDASNRKYYRCLMKAKFEVCPTGKTFDQEQNQCVSFVTQPPTTLTPTLSTTQTPTTIQTTQTTTSSVTTTPVINWSKYFKCQKVGLFKNPYDCTSYFWCYPIDRRHIGFALQPCPVDERNRRLIFDPNPGDGQDPTCDRIEQYVRKHGPCIEEPLPSTPPYHS